MVAAAFTGLGAAVQNVSIIVGMGAVNKHVVMVWMVKW